MPEIVGSTDAARSVLRDSRPVTRPAATDDKTRRVERGLSESEAARRLDAQSRPRRQLTGRSYTAIVRANIFTFFNLILAVAGGLTLVFGDWQDALFLGVLVSNASIGITQEVRAKRALDRLASLVAPHASVVRDGAVRQIAIDELVVGDLVRLGPGDQVVADGTLEQTDLLRLDESILTGESRAVERHAGEEIRSGSFAVEGDGTYVVTAVGEQSYAAKLTGEARSFDTPAHRSSAPSTGCSSCSWR